MAKELIAYLKLMTQEVKEYSDDLVRGLLEKIIVNADRLVIEFEYSVLRVPLIRDRIPSVAQSVPLTY